MKYSHWVGLGFFGIAAFCGSADAGEKAGNGGGAFVCRDGTGNIKSAQLMDLWESEDNGLTVVRSDAPVDAQVKAMLDKIGKIDPQMQPLIKEALRKTTVKHMRGGVALAPPTDTKYGHFPIGCPLEGVASYHDETNTLEIQGEIVDKFVSRTDEAALVIHEAIYKVLREKYHASDSLKTREIVGKLFSTIDFSHLHDNVAGVPANARGCVLSTDKGWDDDFVFYLYRVGGFYRAQFTVFDGRKVKGKMIADFSDAGCLAGPFPAGVAPRNPLSTDGADIYSPTPAELENWRNVVRKACTIDFTAVDEAGVRYSVGVVPVIQPFAIEPSSYYIANTMAVVGSSNPPASTVRTSACMDEGERFESDGLFGI